MPKVLAPVWTSSRKPDGRRCALPSRSEFAHVQDTEGATSHRRRRSSPSSTALAVSVRARHIAEMTRHHAHPFHTPPPSEHRAGPRRLRRRVRLAGRLRHADARTGYDVSVVQNPTMSLDGDVAATKRCSTSSTGRSCSSATPTAAPSSPRPAPTKVGGAGLHRRVRSRQGRVGQHAHRRSPARRAGAADPAATGRLPVPRPGQVPRVVRRRPPARTGRVHGRLAGALGRRGLGGAITDPAWRSKPSWYLVATDDRMIPPPAQRAMAERAGATVTEDPGSHAVYVSRPEAVAYLIKTAAAAVHPG